MENNLFCVRDINDYRNLSGLSSIKNEAYRWYQDLFVSLYLVNL